MCASMVDIQSPAAEIRRGKKDRKIDRNHRAKIYWPPYFIGRPEQECGPMPNVMAAQPTIGGTISESFVIPFLVLPRKVCWLTPAAGVPYSNAANIGEGKTWTQSEYCTGQNSVRGQEPPKMYI